MIRCMIFGVLLCLLGGCDSGAHFITDPVYRKVVENDFENKKQLLSAAPENLFEVFDRQMSREEREALQFLYAYSPIVDLTMYGGDFLLDNVRMSLKIREEMPWGKKILEAVFRHFVLPVRGHNESLDSSRMVFYGELRDRVKKSKSMEEAALEVNHWCHENVIYLPTDGRTCSPLATMKTAYGRCGEESIFALAAFRSVGIPARQVYTPRWAHCDDNHAWIEVWVDGVWKYLGACEPEPHLNIAWFNAPVKRAIYVETEVFGKYEGDEEIVFTNACYSGVNVTGNYTDVKKALIKVVDKEGRPVEAAKVEYKVFNYGEYNPVVTLFSDKNGESSLTVGMGNIVVWASKGEMYGLAGLNIAESDDVKIVLDKQKGDTYAYEYDLVPPVEGNYAALATDEERAVNDRRFVYEDSVRNAYIATFLTPEDAAAIAAELGVDAQLLTKYIRIARGNAAGIVRFLKTVKPEQRGMAMQLLGVVSGKDLQDTPAGVFTDHLTYAAEYAGQPFFEEYILNPRIKNELIVAYRAPLKKFLKEKNVSTVESLIQEMKRIEVCDSVNAYRIITPVSGVLRSMLTDTPSKEVFFVAACRTLGIPARLNPMTKIPEYNEKGEWKILKDTETQTVPKGWLIIKNIGGSVSDPLYFVNFTIAKVENGRTRTIDLGSNTSVDMGAGAAYSSIFKNPVELEAGDYILATGNRRSDGAVLAGISSFTIKDGETTDVEMKIRENNEQLQVLGTIEPDIKYMPENSDISSQFLLPEKGYTVLVLMAANKEPTNHLLRDMSNMKDDFEALGIQQLFLFTDKQQLDKFSRSDFRALPSTMKFGYDPDGKIISMVEKNLRLQNTDNLPLILAVNRKGEVVFISQGYRIGLGNQIMKFMKSK